MKKRKLLLSFIAIVSTLIIVIYNYACTETNLPEYTSCVSTYNKKYRHRESYSQDWIHDKVLGKRNEYYFNLCKLGFKNINGNMCITRECFEYKPRERNDNSTRIYIWQWSDEKKFSNCMWELMCHNKKLDKVKDLKEEGVYISRQKNIFSANEIVLPDSKFILILPETEKAFVKEYKPVIISTCND